MTTRAINFPLMDSIRGIALLTVILTHTAFFVRLSGQEALTKVRFDFGVRVFFIISAFLLWRPFVRALLRDYERPTFKAFFWRRALRILPPYWVALTITAIAGLTVGQILTAERIPLYYGFAQIYSSFHAPGGLPQAWSLCVEVVFYALLPVMAVAMSRLRAAEVRTRLSQQLWLAAGIFAISIAYKAYIVQAGTLENPDLVHLQLQMPAFADDFAIGMALAALSVWYEGRGSDDQPRALRLLDRHPGIPWAVALLATWVTSTQLGLTGQLGEPVTRPDYLARHYLFTIVAVGLVLPAMFGDPRNGLVRRVLANRVLLYLGMVSYAVYLWHFAVLSQLQDWGFVDLAADTSEYIWYPAVMAGGVALATLSWYLVERPFLRLKRLVPQRPEPQPGEAIAEPAPVAPPRPQTG